MRGLLATRVCPYGQRPGNIDINGTSYVICTPQDTQNDSMILGLGIGLGLGIPVMILIGFCLWNIWKRRRDYPSESITDRVTVQLPVKRRWEDFIHEGSYIRRIAQLLENEESIPRDIADYFAENFPDVWEKVNQPSYDFVSRSAKLIKVLFDEQAKIENKPVADTIKAWEDKLVDKLVDKAGGEFGYTIMERVKKLC